MFTFTDPNAATSACAAGEEISLRFRLKTSSAVVDPLRVEGLAFSFVAYDEARTELFSEVPQIVTAPDGADELEVRIDGTVTEALFSEGGTVTLELAERRRSKNVLWKGLLNIEPSAPGVAPASNGGSGPYYAHLVRTFDPTVDIAPNYKVSIKRFDDVPLTPGEAGLFAFDVEGNSQYVALF